MRPCATDDPVACVSVCLSVTRMRCAKTAERIDMLLGVETSGDPNRSVLDGCADVPTDTERRRQHCFALLYSDYFVVLLELSSTT